MRTPCAFGAIAALLLAGTAAAQSVVLGDAQLADVTAGFYDAASGAPGAAAIVGDSADALVGLTAAVTLDADAQVGAKAAALVNGAHSSVANGSNVWDGRAPTGGAGGSAALQGNRIRQQGPAPSHLGDWRHEGANQVTSRSETYASSFSGGIEPAVFRFQFTGDGDTSESGGESRPDEVLRIGKGAAFAGEVNLAADSGSFGFDETDTTTTTITTTATTAIRIKIWKFWITLHESETEITTTAELRSEVSGTVTLPAMSLHAKGVTCSAVIGSCLPYVGEYQASSHTEETTLSPAQLQGGSAERIVTSDGTLHDVRESDIALEGRAQSGIAVLHAVNAAGGRVANGLNVARAGAATGIPRTAELQQANQIRQFR